MNELFEELPNSTARKARRKHRIEGRTLRMGFVLAIVTGLLVAVLAVTIPLIKDAVSTQEIADYSGDGGPEVTVVIPEGALGSDMAQVLLDADVVASRQAFIMAFNDNPRSGSISAGTYSIPSQISGADAVLALLDPANRAEINITIPEGFTVQQVVERISSITGVPVEDVKSAADNLDALGLPSEANGNLEGWLAPLTYTFPADYTPQQMLTEMVAKRVEELKASGIPQDQWERQLIIGSIAEREVSWPEYYPQVARVIANRIAEDSPTNGLLQMDSMVNYGLGRTSGVPTAEDLEKDTPYNAYMHPGLPPTPIANPGIEVVKATVNPPEGNWVYFVTVDLFTGETLFTDSYDEHLKNVNTFNDWYAEHQDELNNGGE